MRLVGIDYGTKMVGVAVSDAEGRFAMPNCVLENNSGLLGAIKKVCVDNLAEAVVIGESRDLGGEPNFIMKEAELLRGALVRDLGIPVYLEPEFYSTVEAERVQGKSIMTDASAAALILKSYIERHGNNR